MLSPLQRCLTVALALVTQIRILESKVVHYTLEVYYFPGSPDGVHKDQILGINGKFPGPTLEADVGDTMEIILVNRIQNGQNTTLHWHGIRQKGSFFEDGASMVSQCPLPSGRSQIYRFNVTQPGTFWYHSHVNSQYTEGMFGALIVHGTPEVYKYDDEITLMLSDWYHRTAIENEHWHLSPSSRGMPPYPDSGLINGMGRYPCTFARMQNRSCDIAKQMRPVIRIQRNKTYRLRLINAAAVSTFNFSIDGHTLQTIEVDGIDVETPVATDIVSIAPAQRYSFLVTCDKSVENNQRYLIRANLRKEFLVLIAGANINQHPGALLGDVTSILECTDDKNYFSSHRLRNKNVEKTSEQFTWNDIKPPGPDTRKLKFLNEMELRPLGGISAPDPVDQQFVVNAVFSEDFENIRRGSFNHRPFSLPQDKPLLMKLIDGDSFPQGSVPFEIYNGNVIQVVVNNPSHGPHPFHLHGHHYWVLGKGALNDGDYDPRKHNLTLNGVKRDTVVVEEKSWGVIRFVADNPGLWLFHCHIDWHNLSGMALTFIEGADVVSRDIQKSSEAMRVCQMHKHFNNTHVILPNEY